MQRTIPLVALVALAAACLDRSAPVAPQEDGEAPSAISFALKSSARVVFGSDDVGSPFPPAQHDQSFHAKDNVRPQVVVIARGGSVTFAVSPCHQPAVYQPGTTPEDIDVAATEANTAGCPPPRINDPTGRVALGPATAAPGTGVAEWTTPAGTFDSPGRYLVICTTFVHFQFAKMYAWVEVK